MHKKKDFLFMIPFYVLLISVLIIATLFTNKTVSTFAENIPQMNRKTIIVDAGHGGVDGGASSYTGVLESHINLEISLRLNDLLHLLGFKTIMIRTTDESIYTSGNSIAAKKISDLKERVRIVNQAPNAVLISIHQNYYPDERYWGAQVFFSENDDSYELANLLQSQFARSLMPNNNRKCKKADSIYLLQHVQCTAVLIECGFISNRMEEAMLTDPQYQKQLCSVIGTSLSTFLSNT